jgi:hypothetical protein
MVTVFNVSSIWLELGFQARGTQGPLHWISIAGSPATPSVTQRETTNTWCPVSGNFVP